jgi:hypothetical protein
MSSILSELMSSQCHMRGHDHGRVLSTRLTRFVHPVNRSCDMLWLEYAWNNLCSSFCTTMGRNMLQYHVSQRFALWYVSCVMLPARCMVKRLSASRVSLNSRYHSAVGQHMMSVMTDRQMHANPTNVTTSVNTKCGWSLVEHI